MEQTRYDLLLAERLSQCSYLKFSNTKTLHAQLFQHIFKEIKEGVEEDKFPPRNPKIFEITINSQGIIVYTNHKHAKVLKFFRTNNMDRHCLQESMELLEKRLENYGLMFEKPQKCDYSHRFTDIHISVNILKN